jgi:hypothetical protein
MRHSASLLTSLEGVSLAAFKVARELAGNGRSGLTVRFLSKKLEMTEEEVEYILDVNHRLLFMDLTKVKIVAEGQAVLKRICDGLENHGDVPSLLRRVKGLSALEFRRVEELLGIDDTTTKKEAGEQLLDVCYRHPDAVVSYVATRGFSPIAKEVFDLVWQSRDGILPVSKIRAAHGGSDYQVEQALQELFQGFALFEMFRFDAEDRLVRVAGLLKEIRQYRESNAHSGGERPKLKALKPGPDFVESRHLKLSEAFCRIAAAMAARPVRLRGDGDLFREDRRRLSEIVSEEDDPSLSFCLWALESMKWIQRVDSQLEAGEIEGLVPLSRLERHRQVYGWLSGQRELLEPRRVLTAMLDHVKSGQWYTVTDFVDFAMRAGADDEQPTLKCMGAHWKYIGPGSAGQADNRLARSLEETFFWLGVIERGSVARDSAFRITPLGEALLLNGSLDELAKTYVEAKSKFVVQPNFDIVVPVQDTDPLLTVPLDQFAVRTSSGAANVYHISKESFTQAVQEGHDARAFVEFLVCQNRDESLPRNVAMTLEDWMGGMKRVRMRKVWVVESPDALVMADLLHRRKFKKYLEAPDPRLLAILADMPREEFEKLLEKEGFIVE